MSTENPARKSNGRIFVVYTLLLIFGVVCLIKILSLGIKDRGLYTGTSERCLDKTRENWEDDPLAQDSTCNCFVLLNNKRPRRGDIFDDQGRILASDVTVYDITLDGNTFARAKRNKSYLENPSKLDSLVDALSAEFYGIFRYKFPNYNLGYYKQKIAKSFKEKSNVLILRSNLLNEKRWITVEDIVKVRSIPFLKGATNITGLNLTRHIVRMNPYGEMGKRSVGRLVDGRWDGLEYEFNEALHGNNGSNKIVRVNGVNIPLNDNIDPVDGNNIHTTINLEIQNIVHNELLKVLKDYKAEWGCAVVMETRTGEVKAISNLTRIDSGRRHYSEQKNYVINYMLEPGSTFKLASLLGYLDRTPDDSARKYPILAHTFVNRNSAGREFKYIKKDDPDKTEASAYPIEAFQRSSNVGIASMVFDKFSGYHDYLSKIDSLYITTSFSTQLGNVKPPNIKRNAKDFHSYYNACFGTGFTMTPIQTLIYYNAVANDGKMIVPLFVKSISRNKDTLAKYQAEVIADQICKPETIRRAKEYLESVVMGQFGTARRYRDPNFTFAGKTGTRDIWDEKIGGYDRRHNCVSFCGYFPAEDPKYTCVIYIYDVPKKSSIAVEAFTKMARNILNLTTFDALQTIDVTKERKLPPVKIASSGNLQTVLASMGYYKDGESDFQAPYIYRSAGELKPYTLQNLKDNMPNVKNMSSSDAVYELSKAGYKVVIKGKGVVREQEYHSGSGTVMLTLSP